MTVAELIVALQGMDQSLPVVIFDGIAAFDAEDCKIAKADRKAAGTYLRSYYGELSVVVIS